MKRPEGVSVAQAEISHGRVAAALEYTFGMIFNRILSPGEITRLYREPFCGFRWMSIEQLAAYYAVVGNTGIMTPNTSYWGPTF